MKIGLGFAFLAAVIAIALAFSVPFSPWVKPEIRENAKVIKSEEGRCVVETESSNIITIDNCANNKEGDLVTVKYRAQTVVGELVP